MKSGKGPEERRQYLLAEIRKAEDMAAKAASPEVREQWRKIADGYRHLAGLLEKS